MSSTPHSLKFLIANGQVLTPNPIVNVSKPIVREERQPHRDGKKQQTAKERWPREPAGRLAEPHGCWKEVGLQESEQQSR